MFPTRHAVERYQQRVAPVSAAEAFKTLQAAATTARRRSTPRWWTPAAAGPGLLFLYPAALPGVCLLCRDGAILTVFQREVCRGWRSAQAPDTGRSRQPVAYRRPAVGTVYMDAA